MFMMRVVKCCYCSTRAVICDMMTKPFKNNHKQFKQKGRCVHVEGESVCVCVGWGGGEEVLMGEM